MPRKMQFRTKVMQRVITPQKQITGMINFGVNE